MNNIRGIGTDIVEVNRMQSKLEKPGFIQRTFTSSEIDYCEKQKHSAQHFAARFAAKEAYMKALGTGWSKVADFLEIEIYHDHKSAPKIKLHGQSQKHFEESNLKEIFVSLSHTQTNTIAFVIIT